MFRGTEMSMSMTGFCRPSTSLAVMTGSLLEVAAKTTSLLAMMSIISLMGATEAFLPPRPPTMSSSRIACALARLRFTTVTLASGFLLKRANRRSLDIFPAPRMQMFKLVESFLKSPIDFAIMSSTAALDTETEPLPIFVFVRTVLPMRIAAFSIFETILPPEPSYVCAGEPSSTFSMHRSWQALTCAKICASPRTRESSPELTSKRWFVASSPECVKR
mmetsp:Transcript_45278/g.114941  ORF Transcript_45278/g.114941 Transcript_45278/m.114941 type:complete len:219 (+) Transcript_45278:501-1157(+)